MSEIKRACHCLGQAHEPECEHFKGEALSKRFDSEPLRKAPDTRSLISWIGGSIHTTKYTIVYRTSDD